MQSVETKEAQCKDEVEFPSSDMTYKTSSPQIKEEPLVEDSNLAENISAEYEGINLEDDIEKIEESSPESSEDNEEEFGLHEISKQESEHPMISGIPTQNPSESIKSWLQRITEMQNEFQKKYVSGNSTSQIHSLAINNATPAITNTTTTTQPSRIVKYQDLPYMGEITLDNSKPRRGRKPKKADICHLIYKNYGTIFPGTPNPGSYLEKDNALIKKSLEKDSQDNRVDVQNRIISSLLEKRLTQEYHRSKDAKKNSLKEKADQSEPLNLCIRDLNHLKIRLLKKNDNTYTSEIKSEPHSDEDVEVIQETPSPLSSRNDLKFPPLTPDSVSTPSPDPLRTAEGTTAPGGYVYWPNAGVFIHPAALQQQLMMYQRLTNNSSYILPNNHSPKPPPDPAHTTKAEPGSSELRKLVPKIVKPKITHSKERQETDSPSHSTPEVKKRNAPSSENTKAPTKRKRSAIFIPPIPTENQTNPATEVSICKFKFTGGAKPSLQEKKMLSVDSGGNFRYYSGTGDKSMRGYEFFPRETLQQQINNTQGSSTGAFLQASGEKIYPKPPVEMTGSKSSSDFLMSPELPSAASFSKPQTSGHSQDQQRLKKRKSRKSLQREKLEQTFKEKGFLIQTQQTESAEGATYCKFRQLRKFTRYLFRSWKDYLPGNIAEGEQPVNNSEIIGASAASENRSTPSSELSTSNVQ